MHICVAERAWNVGFIRHWVASFLEAVPLVEFMYLVFTGMPGESYRMCLRSLLLCLCCVFRALINSLVCWFLHSTVFMRPGEPDGRAHPAEMPPATPCREDSLASAGTGEDSTIHQADRTALVISEWQGEEVCTLFVLWFSFKIKKEPGWNRSPTSAF